jgi:hypothetical protein
LQGVKAKDEVVLFGETTGEWIIADSPLIEHYHGRGSILARKKRGTIVVFLFSPPERKTKNCLPAKKDAERQTDRYSPKYSVDNEDSNFSYRFMESSVIVCLDKCSMWKPWKEFLEGQAEATLDDCFHQT